MATILRGKLKGQQAKIIQWCNDWFSCQLLNGQQKIVSPTSLQLTEEEAYKILTHDNNGIMFQIYELTSDLRFKRKK